MDAPRFQRIEIATTACRCCGCDDRDVLVPDVRDVEDGIDGAYEIARCTACQLVYLSRSPTPATLGAAYPQAYYTRDRRDLSAVSSALYRLKYWLRFRPLRALKPRAVLEVGCGNASFLTYLESKWPNARMTGTEISFGDLALSEGSRVKLIETEAEHLLLDEQFDLILMHQVLEHLADPIAGLRRIRNALAPGGVLIGEVPNWNSPWRRVFGRFWGGMQVPRHQSFFEEASLNDVLRAAGFDDVTISYPADPGDLSVSFCNWLTAKFRLATPPRRAWFFVPVTALAAPLVFLQAMMLRRSGNLAFRAS